MDLLSLVNLLLVLLVGLSLLSACCAPSPPVPRVPPAPASLVAIDPGRQEEALLHGRVLDFLTAVFTGQWQKARGFLAPRLRAGVSKPSDILELLGISHGPDSFSLSSTEVVGNDGQVDFELRYPQHDWRGRIVLERVGSVWRITAIDSLGEARRIR
jgi:hypothetical protein